MTIKEAKRVIDMCPDVIKRTLSNTGEERLYINKNYILEILDMITNVEDENQGSSSNPTLEDPMALENLNSSETPENLVKDNSSFGPFSSVSSLKEDLIMP